MITDNLPDNLLPSTDQDALTRLERFGGGKLLTQMITLFLDSVPPRLAAARGGVNESDPNAVEMSLHALKSSSAQLGAMQMQRLCARGELLARGGSVDGVGVLVDQLEEEFVRVRSWLENARNPEKG